MKKAGKILLLNLFVALMLSCGGEEPKKPANTGKNAPAKNAKNSNANKSANKGATTLGNQQNSYVPNQIKIVNVKGTVAEIVKGKDGYTAKVDGEDGRRRSVTFSSVALQAAYKEFNVGDTIDVDGDDTLGDGTLIRVTAIK